jgi:ParB family chromosome partitioning protein
MSLRDIVREPIDVPLGLIIPPELPARSQMDEHKLDELAGNIARNGVIQRLILVRVGDQFEVVAGHRRFLASTRAGLVVVPCDVYPTKESALEAVKHAENRFREDMSAAEEAIYFHELLERDHAGDIEALAAALGEKVSYVDGRLQLVLGAKDVFDALMARQITIGVANELNKIPAEDYRSYYLKHAIKGGSTVAVVSGWVQEWKSMYADRGDVPAVPAAPASVHVSQPLDLHYCEVCRRSDPAFIPESVPVHTHCKLAVLKPLLDTYHGVN